MQFTTPSADERLTVEVFRAFAQREIHPVACKYRHRVMPWAAAHDVQLMVAEFGLPGGAIPKAHGGLGLSCATQGLLFEQFIQAGGEALPCVQDGIVVSRQLLAAPPAIRDRYLPDVIAGRKIGALGSMEPCTEASSEPRATAQFEEGHWLVTADSVRVSNGINSDFMICPVRTASGEPAVMLVDRDAHRYEVRLDLATSPVDAGAEIFTTSARVPSDHLLARGDEAQALLAAIRTQQWIHAGLGSVGLMQLALDESIAHARAREEFGRPIAAHRLVAACIAEMATLVESARLMCHRCLALVDADTDCETEAGMARWHAAEAAVRLQRQARQLRGGDAAEWNAPHHHRRESFTRAGADRAVEIQKLVVARALTGISALS